MLLRRWRDSDRDPFARMNRDPAVMEFFPSLLSRVESDALIDRIEAHFAEHGFGLWAAELRASGEFVGYVGLALTRLTAVSTPCVEIGWRLDAAHWGEGLATEGARAVARHAFEVLGLAEIVSFTVPANLRSRRVMEKLGMTYDPGDDFDHPMLAAGHPLRRHVLYRLKRASAEATFLDPTPRGSVCSGHSARSRLPTEPAQGETRMSLTQSPPGQRSVEGDADSAPAPVASREISAQPFLVRRGAVLGAGTMGSRIAAHLANAGIPSLLLDMVPKDGAGGRNRLALSAIEALGKAKPAAFYEPGLASLITPGNFEDDLPRLAECEWVIEAVAENLEIKRALLARVVPHLGPRAVLTTNTSGLPISLIAAGLGPPADGVARRFFGTHFFNPPRYMRLLEIIPAPETDPATLSAFAAFADRLLGKEVVFAHDTPNFIANRIGVAVTFSVAGLMLEQGLTVEEVDALTGQAIGWPRTGTFRLADMVGIDVLAHVAANFPQGVTTGSFAPVLEEIVKRGWLGDKAGQGFYKKIRGADGKEQRLVLDLKTLEYRPLAKAAIPSLEMAKNAATVKERLKLLLGNDPAKDKAAAFLWPLLSGLWNFSADRIGEVARDAPSIDRALRAGFNWEMGPFEMWDAAGVPGTVSRMKALQVPISRHVESLLESGRESWYSESGGECYQPLTNQFEPLPQPPGHARVAGFRRSNGVVRANAGASLVDLGDGVGCIELHSLKNAIGGDVVSLIASVLNPASDAVRDFAAFVVTGDRDNFSVGANLLQLLLAVQEGDWDEVDLAIRAFQQMTAAIKFCPRPVVVAPFGMTLGGGAEMCLHAARRQPHAETYIGLVETGVGLIPGGGGTKEMLLRAVDAAAALAPPDPKDPPSRFAQSAEMLAALRRTLETVALAKVSTSAVEARSLGLLSASDRITLNRERLLLDAKSQAAALADAGYAAPSPRAGIPAPGLAALGALETGIFLMGEAGYASEHDQKVARWAAYILAGGRVTAGSLISEQYLLDLEREAFLSLSGERKTQERIAFTLKTGKPLRN
ncbi:MAG TPA: GNAT family N-acetyltransferase [Terracidiphilus sp.]|nr:GNAT family N-acetyltransferase [Terracidiphilus sp.]